MMLEDVRKYLEVALEKLTPARAQEITRSLMQGQGKDQVAKAAQELLEWSQKNRDRLKELVDREVKSQLKTLGVATQDDLDAVKKRVRELERSVGSKRSTAKKSGSKRSTARSATA